jgi:pyruvate-ferredoxin/flavodoxin oxidoreductase
LIINEKGEKVGLVSVHLVQAFLSVKYFFNVMPSTVKRICVLDRTKEPGANGDPLYLDVIEAFYDKAKSRLLLVDVMDLSSKDTTPAMIISVINNLKMNEPKNRFTVGIVDDVTFTSFHCLPEIDLAGKGTTQAKFYGIGADGTVGANKNSIKIIGDTTDKYCQAYFSL